MEVNKIIACTVMAIMVLAMFVSCVTNRNFVAMPEWANVAYVFEDVKPGILYRITYHLGGSKYGFVYYYNLSLWI
jgi:hypothetical protein